jgi:hypothetical protein
LKAIHYHVLWPLVSSLGILTLAFMPTDVAAAIGCRNRGLRAALLALSSGLFGIVAAFTAIIFRLRGKRGSERWMLSAALFVVPVALLLILA